MKTIDELRAAEKAIEELQQEVIATIKAIASGSQKLGGMQ